MQKDIVSSYKIEEVKNHPLFKDLHLSNDEVRTNLLALEKIIHQNVECANNNEQECSFGGFHVSIKRNKMHKLEILTIKCPKYKNICTKALINQNLVYSEINLKNHEQLIRKEDIDTSSDDKERIKFVNFLLACKRNQEVKSFYVYGEFSTGKTYLTLAFCNELMQIGKQVSIISMPIFATNIRKIVSEKKSTNEFCESIMKSDVLVIDEFGNECMNKYVHFNVLYPMLLYRLENNLPTIFCSNYSIERLTKKYSLDNYQGKSEKDIKLFMNRISKCVIRNVFKLSNKYGL